MGLRVLLVRDEALVSGGIKKTLTNLGCNVIGPVTSVVASLAVLDRERVNLALIDSTSSDMRLPIADALVEKRIPFAYISGRGLENWCHSRFGCSSAIRHAFQLRSSSVTDQPRWP